MFAWHPAFEALIYSYRSYYPAGRNAVVPACSMPVSVTLLLHLFCHSGTTYSTDCALLEGEPDLVEIPDAEGASASAVNSVLTDNDTQATTPVIFDIETTGLSGDSQITQLAASTMTGQKEVEYSQYVLPSCSITTGASEVTGLTIAEQANSTRRLLKDGRQVETVSESEMLASFLDWLPQPSCILLAHNCRSFDMRVLVAALQRADMMETAKRKISGFVDTLPLLKELLPAQPTYSLGALYKAISGQIMANAHDAKGDVHALCQIMTGRVGRIDIKHESLLKHSTTLGSAIHRVQNITAKLKRERVLKAELCTKGVVTKYMAEKIAGSGLEYQHLRLAFMRNKDRGLSALLGEKAADGKVRVTRSKKIVDALQAHFRSLEGQ